MGHHLRPPNQKEWVFMAPLAYLRQELNQDGKFISEWRALDEGTKDWYKAAATTEMKSLGIEIR